MYMRTLLVCFMLGLTACNEGGSSQSESTAETILKLWTLDISATQDKFTVDLSSATYGSATVTAEYYSFGTLVHSCSCTATVSGDTTSGTVTVGYCTLITGSTPCSSAVDGFDILEYDFASFGVRSHSNGMPYTSN